MDPFFKYILVGGGLASACAVEGIRQHDRDGEIALFCAEEQLPYHRPPLTKGLWSGKKHLEDLPVHGPSFYTENNVQIFLGTRIAELQPARRRIVDQQGRGYAYERLLLATGGEPRRLPNDNGLVQYYRTARDYFLLRSVAEQSHEVLVVGGGFIGAELAASLCQMGKQVTMLFPETSILQRNLSPDLSAYLTEYFRQKGVQVLSGDRVAEIGVLNKRFHVVTEGQHSLWSDWVVAGMGIRVDGLAEKAGLDTNDGVEVNNLLQASDPAIFAAGDLCRFPSALLGQSMRVEHWDAARSQGRFAGENMAGAGKPYDYQPFFFSDLFDLGFEAVGRMESDMQVVEDWEEKYRKGVLYFLRDGMLRGVINWNVWHQLDAARALIAERKRYASPEELKGRIQFSRSMA